MAKKTNQILLVILLMVSILFLSKQVHFYNIDNTKILLKDNQEDKPKDLYANNLKEEPDNQLKIENTEVLIECPSNDLTWTYLDEYKSYTQETRYYCVPAAIKSCIEYITGDIYSQENLAFLMETTRDDGTTLLQAQKFLNTHQEQKYYDLVSYPTSIDIMKKDFTNAITKDNVPSIIGVKISTDDGWPYNSRAHALSIVGIESTNEYFYLADSYITCLDPDASMFYTKLSSDIWNAIKNCEEGYLY